MEHTPAPLDADLAQRLLANLAELTLGGPPALALQGALIALIALAAWAGAAALRWALARQQARRGGDPALSGRPLDHLPLVALAAAVLALATAGMLDRAGHPSRLVDDFAALALAAAGVQAVLSVVGRTPLGGLIAGLIMALAAVSVLGLSGPLIEALDAPGIDLGGVRLSPWFFLRAIVVFVSLIWVANRIGQFIERQAAAETVLSASGRVLFAKLAHFTLIVAAALIGLGTLGIDVTALAFFSGALGLGLGFGLQRIVANFTAGLVLLGDKSVKPGDVIELDFGAGPTRGRVTALAARYTAITSRLGTEILIPNDLLITNAVTNWSHSSKEVQIRIPVPVSYASDVELAQRLCREAAHKPARVLAEPQAACLLLGFGSSAVNMEVRFWIRDPESGVKNVSSDVYLEIWRAFRAHGVEIPFLQHDVHIRAGDTLDVRLTGGAEGPARQGG